ncbi:hypothetical protein BITS_1827 [Bifidobacterium tsurumiense]|uniref:Uncharacterized protein n=1 Tax=Bifidobacterium tsurumiense TaxID=356829 RepID=A0A087ED79_9BIFI|nr:hypothetical protein BITS_1827 [Bifidobacterium tsurumiense]
MTYAFLMNSIALLPFKWLLCAILIYLLICLSLPLTRLCWLNFWIQSIRMWTWRLRIAWIGVRIAAGAEQLHGFTLGIHNRGKTAHAFTNAIRCRIAEGKTHMVAAFAVIVETGTCNIGNLGGNSPRQHGARIKTIRNAQPNVEPALGLVPSAIWQIFTQCRIHGFAAFLIHAAIIVDLLLPVEIIQICADGELAHIGRAQY